jgi:hypothetical protein
MNPDELLAQTGESLIASEAPKVEGEIKNPELTVVFNLAVIASEDLLQQLEQHFSGSYSVPSLPTTPPPPASS